MANPQSASNTADEEVCIATADDKDAVLKIDPDYHGLDYLADTYSTFTQGHGSKGYVLKKAGEVVGFFSVQLVDDGKTLLTAAGRILEAHRGGGFYGRATKKVFETYRDSGVEHIAMSLNNLNLKNFGEKLLKQYKIVHARQCGAYEVDMDAVKMSGVERKAADLKGIYQLASEDELKQLMAIAGDHLFTDGRIMIELKPYRVLEQNAHCIFHGGTHERVFLISKVGADISSVSSLTFSPGDALLFSCGGYYYNQVGMTYIVDLYATEKADISDEIKKHLEWHLLRLVNVLKPPKAYFSVFFDRQMGQEMKDLSKVFPNKHAGFPYTDMTAVEMDYKY